MQLDVQLSDHLTESEFFTKNPHVINLEDSLLDLASSWYILLLFMKVSLGDKSLHMARIFECNAFAGFFWSKGHDTLKEYLQLDQ